MIQTVNQKDHAGNPDREHRVATVCGGTHGSVDKAHVERLVEIVVAAAGDCSGAELRLHAFMPPYANKAEAPNGYMEFWIEAAGAPDMMFAVEFGGKEFPRLVFDALSQEMLLESAENSDPSDYASVASFDELWLFACNVAERLKVAKLHMSYGI